MSAVIMVTSLSAPRVANASSEVAPAIVCSASGEFSLTPPTGTMTATMSCDTVAKKILVITLERKNASGVVKAVTKKGTDSASKDLTVTVSYPCSWTAPTAKYSYRMVVKETYYDALGNPIVVRGVSSWYGPYQIYCTQ